MSPSMHSSNGPEKTLLAEPIVGVTLDGNALSVVEVAEGVNGNVIISSANQSENNELLEKILQFRHPIHQSVNHVEYPNLEKLVSQLGLLLEKCPLAKSSVVSLPEDVINHWEDHLNGHSQAEVYSRGIRSVCHPNPYGYPMLVEYTKIPKPRKGVLKLWSMRFDDFLHTAELFYPLETTFLGAVTGHRALQEIIPRVLKPLKDQPQVVVHLGKLRTTYIGMLNGEVLFSHTIPVGISRDGSFYFQTLSPNLKRIGELINDLGTLILPADTTPTRFFNRELLSPQSEATRFAHQIGEYCTKIRREYFRDYENDHVNFYLSGTVSRLKGLLEYLKDKTGLDVDFFKHHLNDVLEYPATMDCCVTDHLVSIGTCLAYNQRGVARSGMILTDQRPKSVKSISSQGPEIMAGEPYVVEYPHEKLGSYTPSVH